MNWSERYAGKILPFPKKECYYCGNDHDGDLEKIDKGVWACKDTSACSKRVPPLEYE